MTWPPTSQGSWQPTVPGKYQNRLKAVPIDGDTQKLWRMVGNQLKLRREECKTLDLRLEMNCLEYGSLQALGTRQILSKKMKCNLMGKSLRRCSNTHWMHPPNKAHKAAGEIHWIDSSTIPAKDNSARNLTQQPLLCCSGDSAMNPIEHLWAPCTRALTSVYLPSTLPGEDKPPCQQSGLAKDEKEAKEDIVFDRAMDHIRDIYWRDLCFAGHKVNVNCLIMGDYKWRTYAEFFEDSDNFGKGLVSLGLQPKQNILIFAETRAEFQIGLQACFRYNFPVVTLYATLGEAAIAYGINQTGIKYVITTTTLLTKLKSIQKDIPTVTHIICMEDPVTKLDEKKLSNGIKVTSFQSVINRGAASKNVQRLKPKADDLAIIMYTSGSTGNPKGVMISHRNVLAAVCGAVDRIDGVETGEAAAVYLPLAHILEVVVEFSLITLGCRLGYSSPQTLTDTGTRLKKGCPGDVRILKPQLIVFVPMILERIYKGVTEKLKEGSAIQRAIFNFAVDYKCKHLEQGFNTPLLNRLIFSKLTRQLGGHVRLMICGGAPLASNLQRFIQSCFNSSLIQGYGLTETCGVACVSEPRDLRIGHVGPPLTTTQVKLSDWPEGGYTNKDKPNPRGEVIVGGQNIAMGYYQMDQLTKEVFIQDNGIRYFCTGDIGEFLPDGSLKIIGK
nr:long-chain-fatty-acid--CoA ligase 4-like [Lytechinus pictus]